MLEHTKRTIGPSVPMFELWQTQRDFRLCRQMDSVNGSYLVINFDNIYIIY